MDFRLAVIFRIASGWPSAPSHIAGIEMAAFCVARMEQNTRPGEAEIKLVLPGLARLGHAVDARPSLEKVWDGEIVFLKELMKAEQQELIAVLRETRTLLAQPENELLWSSWESTEDAAQELDDWIARIKEGTAINKVDLPVLYAPTGSIQEVSISSGWGKAFLALARRFDAAIDFI